MLVALLICLGSSAMLGRILFSLVSFSCFCSLRPELFGIFSHLVVQYESFFRLIYVQGSPARLECRSHMPRMVKALREQ